MQLHPYLHLLGLDQLQLHSRYVENTQQLNTRIDAIGCSEVYSLEHIDSQYNVDQNIVMVSCLLAYLRFQIAQIVEARHPIFSVMVDSGSENLFNEILDNQVIF